MLIPFYPLKREPRWFPPTAPSLSSGLTKYDDLGKRGETVKPYSVDGQKSN